MATAMNRDGHDPARPGTSGRTPGRRLARWLITVCLCFALAPWHASAQAPDQSETPGPAPREVAADPVSARDALESFTRDLDALGASFEQVVISPDGAVMESAAGEVWLQRPDRFRWSIGGEFPELIVADGAFVWMYDESLDQVTVRDQSGLEGDSPLLVILDREGLDERFEITELGTVTGLHLLELNSRSPEDQFERIVLGFQDGDLRRLVLEDAFGLRTELSFSGLRRNPAVPDGHFEFTPPPGADVVGDLPSVQDS
jgi:outer membrane lipoprotein carrier protein